MLITEEEDHGIVCTTEEKSRQAFTFCRNRVVPAPCVLPFLRLSPSPLPPPTPPDVSNRLPPSLPTATAPHPRTCVQAFP